MTRPVFFMCPPEHFNVDYEINPWMRGNLHLVDVEHAAAQWQALHALLSTHAEVRLASAQAGLPDMVFTANAGLVYGKIFVPSNFAHPERQGERAHFVRWFEAQGFAVADMPHQGPQAIAFEGAGDALYSTDAPILWVGHGFRTDARAAEWLRARLPVEVVPLKLVDPRYYHLDTCFCPLPGGVLLWNPLAFDAPSRAAVEARVAAARRIEVGAQDAAAFACNAVAFDDVVVLNHASAALRTAFERFGLRVLDTPLSEFMKSGGSSKCLTLRLDAHFAPWAAHRFEPTLARAA